MSEALLGIDVGGTKVALCFATAAGELLGCERLPTPASGDVDADVAQLAERVRALAGRCNIDLGRLRAAGLSFPGPHSGTGPESTSVAQRTATPAGGTVPAAAASQQGTEPAGAGASHQDAEPTATGPDSPPNLPAGWHATRVRALLAEALGLPFALENDANAAALAEWRFGAEAAAGRRVSGLVYLTMSTGVGAGLVLNGRLLRGRGNTAGELGHLPVVWEGDACACGMRGCLEAYIGGAAWSRRLAKHAPENSGVVRLAGARRDARPEHVLRAAREGDAFALAELERFNHYLAIAVLHLVYLLAPEVVVLGTIPSAAGAALCIDPLREKVHARLWPIQRAGLSIRPISLGERLPEYAGLCAALEAGRAEAEKNEA